MNNFDVYLDLVNTSVSDSALNVVFKWKRRVAKGQWNIGKNLHANHAWITHKASLDYFLVSNSPYCLPYHSYGVWFWEFGFGSTYNPVIDIFLYSQHLSAWFVLILWGEILSWSLMRVKRLINIFWLVSPQ